MDVREIKSTVCAKDIEYGQLFVIGNELCMRVNTRWVDIRDEMDSVVAVSLRSGYLTKIDPEAAVIKAKCSEIEFSRD